MEMATEPKTQAPQTVRIGRDFVIKPSKIRIIIELDEGMTIDPKYQNEIEEQIQALVSSIENASKSLEHETYELLPGEF